MPARAEGQHRDEFLWSSIDVEMGVNAILGVTEDELFELAGFRKGRPED